MSATAQFSVKPCDCGELYVYGLRSYLNGQIVFQGQLICTGCYNRDRNTTGSRAERFLAAYATDDNAWDADNGSPAGETA